MKNSQDIGLPKFLLKKKETFCKLKTFEKRVLHLEKSCVMITLAVTW